MAKLTFIEKNKLEKLFEMRGGYVLNFSDRTFREFVTDSTRRNIYDSKYDYESGSKANRLRAFWSVESDQLVGKLTQDLLTYLAEEKPDVAQSALFKGCRTIALRLLGVTPKSDHDVSGISPSQEPTSKSPASGGKDPRNVFVVHGRNAEARNALFRFLRSIGLHPLEWSHAIELTGKAAPYIGEILDVAFANAQAVLVLMTPDDEARLRQSYRQLGDPDYERSLTGQARPNVLFEAGMALGRYPDRTLLVELGILRPFSDIGGRHVLKLTNSSPARQNVATRLKNAGCPVDLTGTDWHTEGDFESVTDGLVSEENDGAETIDVNAIFARLSRLAAYEDFYLYYEIPTASLKNAKDRFLPPNEDVMAFLDNTEANSGRNGVAFTNTGVFWRNSHTEEEQQLSWHDLPDKSIVGDERNDDVRLDSDSIDLSYSAVPADELAGALRDIVSILTS